MNRIAIFPGSFDPFTKAHLDIVERGLSMFDHIKIAVGVNNSKKGMFSFDQRKRMIESAVLKLGDRVSVEFFEGLTVQFAMDTGAKFILRSMRSAQDYDFEWAIAQNNVALAPNLESVFLLSDRKYSHISSTIVREILVNKGDVSHLLPPEVMQIILTESIE